MKKLLVRNCLNPLARVIWVKQEYKKECMEVLKVLPYIESVSGSLGTTQVLVMLSALAEQKEIDAIEDSMRAITGPEE